MDTRLWFAGLVFLVAAMRMVELAVSSRNIRRLKARGAVEVGYSHYPWMVMVHVGWLVSCVLEVWLFDRPWLPPLAVAMIVLLAGATSLRYWVIRTLGERWSTRIVFVPGGGIETRGPYRWLKHPNYLGVILELFVLPMVHTAWLTAVFFGVANAVVLRQRIAAEEAALRDDPRYDELMGRRGRLIPGDR
jgi:methyltransferase